MGLKGFDGVVFGLEHSLKLLRHCQAREVWERAKRALQPSSRCPATSRNTFSRYYSRDVSFLLRGCHPPSLHARGRGIASNLLHPKCHGLAEAHSTVAKTGKEKAPEKKELVKSLWSSWSSQFLGFRGKDRAPTLAGVKNVPTAEGSRTTSCGDVVCEVSSRVFFQPHPWRPLLDGPTLKAQLAHDSHSEAPGSPTNHPIVHALAPGAEFLLPP